LRTTADASGYIDTAEPRIYSLKRTHMRTPFRLLLLWLLIVPGAWPQGTNLPEGKGKAQFARICGECHAVEIVVRKTNTEDGWAAIVYDMISRGAQGTDDDFSLAVKYLAAHFAPKVKINTADANELSTILGAAPLELLRSSVNRIASVRSPAG
jgi:hypothetical protein